MISLLKNVVGAPALTSSSCTLNSKRIRELEGMIIVLSRQERSFISILKNSGARLGI